MSSAKNKTTTAPEPLLVTVDTLAKRYGLSPKTVYRWSENGKLPVIKLSAKCIRFPLAECDALIEKRRVKSMSEIAAKD